MARKSAAYRLRLETLEARVNPTEVRLDVVALHEFGHALGLEHHSNPASIMHDEYNPNYDTSTLASDPAVIVDPFDGYLSLLEIYTDTAIASNTTRWKDRRDYEPGNGVLDLSFSIMPDGTKIRKKLNVINSTFGGLFGSEWVGILWAQLNNWAGASGGRLTFTPHGDAGRPFNYDGTPQKDKDSGDIRIGAIPLGGDDMRLAQTYGPPPNGKTAPGDVHFNAMEDWILPPPPPPPVPPGDPIPDGDGIDMGDGGNTGGGDGSGQPNQPSGAGGAGTQNSTGSGGTSQPSGGGATLLSSSGTNGSPVDGLFGGPFAGLPLI